MFTSSLRFLFLLFFLNLVGFAAAHPIPDIPVRSYFEEDGSLTVRVEIDPRCFWEDPEMVQYTYMKDFMRQPEGERNELKQQAKAFITNRVQFFWEPNGPFQPEFDFEFTTFNNTPLEKAYDYVMLTGTWNTKVPAEATGYQLVATKVPDAEVQLNVVFRNFYRGEQLQELHELFGDEKSFVLKVKELPAQPLASEAELEAIHSTSGFSAALSSFLRAGWVSVFPVHSAEPISWIAKLAGFAHAIFLMALLIRSRVLKEWGREVAVFVAATLIAILIGAAGGVRIPLSLLVPIVGVSLLVAAVETILRKANSPWPLVGITIFGLAHGLLLAHQLGNFELVAASKPIALLGFCLGVVLAMAAVVFVVRLLTIFPRKAETFQKWVAWPISALIFIIGILVLVF